MKIASSDDVTNLVGIITMNTDGVPCVRLIRIDDDDNTNDPTSEVRIYLDGVRILGSAQEMDLDYQENDEDMMDDWDDDDGDLENG